MNFVPLNEAWGEEEFQTNLIENIFESRENYLLIRKYILNKEFSILKLHLWNNRFYYSITLFLMITILSIKFRS